MLGIWVGGASTVYSAPSLFSTYTKSTLTRKIFKLGVPFFLHDPKQLASSYKLLYL